MGSNSLCPMVRSRLASMVGYVRAAHKQGWFEVIAGKSVVAFRREEVGRNTFGKVFRVRANL